MARLNRPSLMVYGGTIKPGQGTMGSNATLDIVSAFQSYGEQTKIIALCVSLDQLDEAGGWYSSMTQTDVLTY